MNIIELVEKRTSSPVFLPLHFTRKVSKDKDEEKNIVGLLIFKNQNYLV